MYDEAVNALREKGCSLKIDDAGRVWYLYASEMRFTAADAERVAELSGLRELSLSRCAHDDSMWSAVARLPTLERLELVGRNPKEPIGSKELLPRELFDPRPMPWSGVSDWGSRALRSLPNLKSLGLTCTETGNATLEHVGNVQSLEELVLLKTRISGAGMQFLRPLRRLKWLSTPNSSIDDKSLEGIADLSSLTMLELYGTKITNRGLAHIGRLAALETLFMHNTDVWEEGFAELLPLSRLKTLYVGGPITEIGARFLERLPSLRYLCVRGGDKGRWLTDDEYKWLCSRLPNLGIE